MDWDSSIFQSTPSQRGRQYSPMYGLGFKYISIHALAKRATVQRIRRYSDRGNFNPRPRKEGDSIVKLSLSNIGNFNPRPRKEGDMSRLRASLQSCYFNPRPRKEGDARGAFNTRKSRYFNPRPRKEGDISDLMPR